MTGGFAAAALGPFGLGTAPLAGLYTAVDEDEARGALAAAWAGGVRYFDTAPHYGVGLAERRLGHFLGTVDRAEAYVSTKVGRLLVPGPPDADSGFAAEPNLTRQWDYSRAGVLRSLDESLERSGLDRFDLVLIHDPDDHWDQALTETYPALADLRAAGTVGAIGVGMNQSAMLARFVRETDIDAVLVAGRYTLLDRGAADDLLPLCHQRGVSVVVGGVFNGGVLVDPRPGARFDYLPASGAIRAEAVRMRDVCASFGVPLAAAAMRFPLRHPAVTGILVGARDAAEVAADLAMRAHPIPDELWDAL